MVFSDETLVSIAIFIYLLSGILSMDSSNGMLRSKKAQLLALEIKELSIGFIVGVVVTLVALVALSLTGNMPGFVCNFLC